MKRLTLLLWCVLASPAPAQQVLMLDDFETTFTPHVISLARRSWYRSSLPVVSPAYFGIAPTAANRGKLIWYNPQEQVPITHIYPDLEVNSRTGILTNALVLERRFDPHYHPVPIPDEEWWGGITTTVPAEQTDFRGYRAMELLVQGTRGILYIDIGRISEDQNGDGEYQTEDFYGKFKFENGIFAETDGFEDLGVHGPDPRTGQTVPDSPNNGETYDDDWSYTSRSNNYLKINGTEGNGTGDNVDGLRIPDTEDINRNGNLDLANDYVTYRLNLDSTSAEYSRYLAGGTMNAVDASGNPASDRKWRKFRIPLGDYTEQTGTPDWSAMQYIRIRIENLPLPELAASEDAYTDNIWNMQSAQRPTGELKHLVSIASIGFLPMHWTRADDFTPYDRDGRITAAPLHTIQINAISTDRAGYASPPGVTPGGEPVHGFPPQEQSLALEYRNLPPLSAGALVRHYTPTTLGPHDIQQFDYLELFVHGGAAAAQQEVDVFVRFGTDNANFFEARARLYPGWDERNTLSVPLQILKDPHGDFTMAGPHVYRRVGNPELSGIQEIMFGVINTQEQGEVSGAVWFDELRARKGTGTDGSTMKTNDALVLQNYPNPFNASTSITFGIPETEQFTLDIYDIVGRKVRSLVQSDIGNQGGAYSVQWDGRDGNGHALPSGVYIVRLQYTTNEILYDLPPELSIQQDPSGSNTLVKMQKRTRSVARKILMLR